MTSQYSPYDMTRVLLPTAFVVSLARKSHVMCKRARRGYHLARLYKLQRNIMTLHYSYLCMISQYSSYDMTRVLLPTAFIVSLARKSHVMCKSARRCYNFARLYKLQRDIMNLHYSYLCMNHTICLMI